MSTSKFAASALIALASVAATSAFAGNDNNYPVLSSDSQKTRAQVQAEVVQAFREGSLLPARDDSNYPVIKSDSTKTRAQVRAEYQAALKAGEIVRVRS